MFKRNYVLKLATALLLILFLAFFLYKRGYFVVIEKISFDEIVILLLITLTSYFVAGFQIYYLVKKQNYISISLSDTLLLPISMSLYSYIIPTNGGLLFSVFFLNKKYNIDTSKSFSIGIFSVYISLIITGIFGVVSCIISNNYSFWILSISFILISISFIISVLNRLFQKLHFKEFSFINRIKLYLNKIVIQSNNLLRNKSILFVNIIINVIYLILAFISYQWLNVILEINLSLTSVFIIVLITKVSSLIRLVPGNIGLNELYTGGIFKIIGKDPGIGIVFSIIQRITAMIVFIPLGILHTFFNSRLIKWGDLVNLRKGSTEM